MHTIEQYHPRQFHYCPTDDCSHGSPDDRSLCKLAGWTPLLCTCSIPQVWYTNCSSGWNLKNRSPKQKKGGHDDELSPFFGRLLTLDWRGLRTWRILHVESNGVQLPSLKYFAHRYCPYGRVFFFNRTSDTSPRVRRASSYSFSYLPLHFPPFYDFHPTSPPNYLVLQIFAHVVLTWHERYWKLFDANHANIRFDDREFLRV